MARKGKCSKHSFKIREYIEKMRKENPRFCNPYDEGNDNTVAEMENDRADDVQRITGRADCVQRITGGAETEKERGEIITAVAERENEQSNAVETLPIVASSEGNATQETRPGNGEKMEQIPGEMGGSSSRMMLEHQRILETMENAENEWNLISGRKRKQVQTNPGICRNTEENERILRSGSGRKNKQIQVETTTKGKGNSEKSPLRMTENKEKEQLKNQQSETENRNKVEQIAWRNDWYLNMPPPGFPAKGKGIVGINNQGAEKNAENGYGIDIPLRKGIVIREPNDQSSRRGLFRPSAPIIRGGAPLQTKMGFPSKIKEEKNDDNDDGFEETELDDDMKPKRKQIRIPIQNQRKSDTSKGDYEQLHARILRDTNSEPHQPRIHIASSTPQAHQPRIHITSATPQAQPSSPFQMQRMGNMYNFGSHSHHPNYSREIGPGPVRAMGSHSLYRNWDPYYGNYQLMPTMQFLSLMNNIMLQHSHMHQLQRPAGIYNVGESSRSRPTPSFLSPTPLRPAQEQEQSRRLQDALALSRLRRGTNPNRGSDKTQDNNKGNQ